MALSETLGIQKVFNIRVFNINTPTQLKAELKKLKESTFTNGQETVFLSGGQGHTRQMSFDYGKTAEVSGSSAVIQGDLLSLQVGSDVEDLTNTTEYKHFETLTINSDAATTTYTPTGTVAAEIGHVWILDQYGTRTTELTQAAAASATEFSLSAKVISFNASDYADGTKVLVGYFPTVSEAKAISNESGNFSYSGLIYMDARFKDCNDQTIFGQIMFPVGKISGAFEWSLSSDGEAATHNFTVTALESCTDTKLWRILWFDNSNIS